MAETTKDLRDAAYKFANTDDGTGCVPMSANDIDRLAAIFAARESSLAARLSTAEKRAALRKVAELPYVTDVHVSVMRSSGAV